MADPATYGIGASNRSIRKLAERVGRHHEIYTPDGCADVKGLVQKLGGVVEAKDGSESLIVREKGNFKIFLPLHTSWRRDRFTLAHELGHYFLHYRYVQDHQDTLGPPAQVFNRGGQTRAETEANTFAASLLMPEAEFRRAYEELGNDSYALAERFEVSPASAAVRVQVIYG